MKRFPFLDWTRGLAVVVMIQCHAFNSFTRMDLRESGPYVLSQFVGGMAAVLFLFMAGMTLAFQMESLDRREPDAFRRWTGALRRGGYVLGIAYLFRITNWMSGALRSGWAETLRNWPEVIKVDILNCMGVAMIAMSIAAVCKGRTRPYFAVLAGLAVAVAAPLISGLASTAAPGLLRAYFVPAASRFAFFPWTAYLAFGLAAGTIVRRVAAERMERLMQWSVLIGFGLVFAGQYFSNIPFSFYAKSEFWIDSPALVFIRSGLCLLALACAYLWTEFCVGDGWSWMQALGKTSLLVYWVHIMLVYGDLYKPFKRGMSIPQAALATVIITGLMVALAAAKLWWKDRSIERVRAVAA